MNPWVMGGLLLAFVSLFLVSAAQKLRLLELMRGQPKESRFNRLDVRLRRVVTYAIAQKKMHYYPLAGIAHQLIFLGFAVLLLRTLLLWGRGFVPDFNLFILGPRGFLGVPLGEIYGFTKDTFAILVLLGVGYFVYQRALIKSRRMTLSAEGLLILGIIASMMLADITYDGASLVLRAKYGAGCSAAASWCERASVLIAPLSSEHVSLTWRAYPEPAGSALALVLRDLDIAPLVVLGHLGFWTHSTLVLIFLNILPHTKHFHIITALPNVFFSDLTPPGRLKPVAASTEALMANVEQAMEQPDAVPAVGPARIEHMTWKDALDFYTCTECGRCSDHCPATMTGKILSPKHLILDLRDHLYGKSAARSPSAGEVHEANGDALPGKEEATAAVDLVPSVIKPEVLWACTTCRACEEQCPVMIAHLEKIIPMRRQLVVMRGEFPSELAKPFAGMESNGNPWNLAHSDRTAWTEGLDIAFLAQHPTAPVLFWVGCAASYDDRAKKIARSTALLLKAAGIDFAILGDEERCTGDPARRSGNEYLFMMLAERNVATLNGYQAQGGVTKIVTTCPHCFNTLLNEYPDLGGRYEVVHHTDYLLDLVRQGRLRPERRVEAKVAYHDSCYLGRYNGIYDAPRQVLESIPGVQVLEPSRTRHKGLCCGAGGAQMFMEEQNNNRMNVNRTDNLLATNPDAIASSCPFCMTMLTDGLKAREREHEIRQLDVAELLLESCDSGKTELPRTAIAT